ncbi:hypothetical protein [Dactylosporangium sp. CA-233914]|uniref:hypothetical protein n=1 Tax=Dactylosporangium sp. CA-233914 TaxID=3239934 RepID=UPI003D9203B0
MAAIHLADRGGPSRAGRPFGEVSRALAQAALAALEAPSVLDTQPWRWRIDGDWAELDADRARRPPGAETGDRLLLVSCGAALHHATVALAAAGVGVEVARFPQPEVLERVAVLRHTGPVALDPRAQRLRRAIAVRGSDRRSIGSRPIPAGSLRVLRAAAAAVGAGLYPLSGLDAGEPGWAVIATAGVGPRDWLATGEAISAVLLNAAAEGLVTAAVTEASASVPPELARLLPPGAGHPAAVVRLGVAPRAASPDAITR